MSITALSPRKRTLPAHRTSRSFVAATRSGSTLVLLSCTLDRYLMPYSCPAYRDGEMVQDLPCQVESRKLAHQGHQALCCGKGHQSCSGEAEASTVHAQRHDFHQSHPDNPCRIPAAFVDPGHGVKAVLLIRPKSIGFSCSAPKLLVSCYEVHLHSFYSM